MQRFSRHLSRTVVVYTWVALLVFGTGCAPALVRADSPSSPQEQAAAQPFVGELFVRTELYFGSLKPDQSHVTQAEFENFLQDVITPRFPDGLTVITGLGQFRDAAGDIIQERARLLILLYPVEDRQVKSRHIETIRIRYKDRFQQESVLRVDRCCELVGF